MSAEQSIERQTRIKKIASDLLDRCESENLTLHEFESVVYELKSMVSRRLSLGKGHKE